jgi:hypothetical protein
MKPTSTEIAINFLKEALSNNFTVVVRGPSCVSVCRSFNAGDKQAFTECDMMAGSVLDVIPQKGGSQFGTDGGSIGGAVALQTGRFNLTATGCSKRVVAALAKIIK